MRNYRSIRPALSLIIAAILSPIRAIASHSRLLKDFVRREIRGRFAGSYAGILWALINPFAMILVYLFIFSVVLRIPIKPSETGTDSFAIFFFSGFFPWLILSESLTRSVGVLLQNAVLITKVVFPVELLPAGSVISAAIINGIGFLLFLLFLIPAGHLHPSWLLLPILIPVFLLFVWGLSTFLAAICVFVRDIRDILTILLMIWFYATPVVYPASMLPDFLRPVIELNPMGIFVHLFRDALLIHRFDPLLLFEAILFAVGAYGLGSWFFMRAKPAFGDVL